MWNRALAVATGTLLWICGAPGVGDARASGFSPPVALPPAQDEDWSFAVDDRGAGGALTVTASGAAFYTLAPEGGLGPETALSVPGGYAALSGSIAVNAQGTLAVGLVYRDGTEAPSDVEHGGPGCCGRVAVADWPLGSPPPPLQVLSPPQSARGGDEHQVFAAPSLAVGPEGITAIWTREGFEEIEPYRQPAELVQAYGRFSEPLRVSRLARAPHGISHRQLSLSADGKPTADWLRDGSTLVGVDGRGDGSLGGRQRVRHLPHLSVSKGFATLTAGSAAALFSWFTNLSPNGQRSRLDTIGRSAGGQFGQTHTIATLDGASSASLAAGAGDVLAVWERASSFSGQDHVYVRLRSRFSPHPRPQSLGAGENATGFIDAHGRAVLIYSRPAGGGNELVASIAEPGRAFGPARPIAPGLGRCLLDHQTAFDPPPPALSPDGHAVLVVVCERQVRSDYMVRYAP